MAPPYQQPAPPAYGAGNPQPGYPGAAPNIGNPGGDPQRNMMPPHNYMVFAICTVLLCGNPVGIFAVVKAANVNKLWQLGHESEARAAAESAKTWSLIALASGLAWVLVWIILSALVAA
ncbi:CD225/dispanin family protein [Tsukamurella spumae]|nr:CD225/dispanin family protein [Tsukamurella spumae]